MPTNGLVQRAYKECYEDWTGAENIAAAAADGVAWLSDGDTSDVDFTDRKSVV